MIEVNRSFGRGQELGKTGGWLLPRHLAQARDIIEGRH